MPTASKAGFVWQGWYTATSSGSKIATNAPALTGTAVSGWTNASKQWVITTTDDKNLYAQWQAGSYTVTYNCNGGLGTAPSAVTVSGGSNADLSSRACKSKAITTGTGTGTSASPSVTFQTGWATTSTGSAVTSYTVTSNVILYATYDKIFTYTGKYTVYDDGSGNFRVEFLTGGTFRLAYPLTADIHAVGGGGGGGANCQGDCAGGGGGGGKTATLKNKYLSAIGFTVTIGTGGAGGASGASGSAGSASSFGTFLTAAGGNGGTSTGTGGNGGSGGGGNASTGGSNGSNGNGSGGTGQGTSTGTRDFGESSGTLRAGGGGGGIVHERDTSTSVSCTAGAGPSGGAGGGGNGGRGRTGNAGTANYGGGGGGAGKCHEANGQTYSADGAAGGSGIVILRNKR